jgi:Ser/Thr protein kinase RdoA (MazF antagonist)
LLSLGLFISDMDADAILQAFGLNPAGYKTETFGAGLINHTLKVSGKGEAYILQRLNTAVFKSPGAIAENLRLVQLYLKNNYPVYLFPAPLPTPSGEYLVKTTEGDFYRLLPFVTGSHSVNAVADKKEAYEAAKQFGKFSRLLAGFDTALLKYTLPDFHNLDLRFEQFKAACATATPARLVEAVNEIKEAKAHSEIVETYRRLTRYNVIPLRVIHHDTKINNVLFDDNNNGLCIVDLDTIMPGYFFSDVGDMVRTYLSPANEEEKDLSKIQVREEFFSEIYRGYLSEMGTVLTPVEKQHFIYAGKLMIYMQALRFLTDFLNNDTYYGSAYPGHNLVRAQNQFTLLDKYLNAEEKFTALVRDTERRSTPNN